LLFGEYFIFGPMAAVILPDLQISLAANSDCSGILLNDITGEYPDAPNGYGLPGGADINDVTDVVITATFSLLGTALVYTFEVTNGEITAATLAIGGGTPTDILSALPSTVFPFVDFDILSSDYGVTMPTFTDDVVEVEYAVSGDGSNTFSGTVAKTTTITCNAECCLDQKAIDLELNCSCKDNAAVLDTCFLNALILQAEASARKRYTERAAAALQKATNICADSGNCGC